MMNFKLNCGLVIVLCLAESIACADTLELKNGSRIEGKFVGGTDSEINFQVASSVQKYNLADIVSIKFDSEGAAGELPTQPESSLLSEQRMGEHVSIKAPAYVTIPAATRITVRTIDGVDSTKNHVGDRFEATLEE